MCGIIGYTGNRPSREILLAGLEKLEYRGYDSAGLSELVPGGAVDSVHAVGNLAHLREAVAARAERRTAVPTGAGAEVADEPEGTAARAGIGHTRWATHGRVTQENAHPHFDTSERVHIVLNGIVENHMDLRSRLESGGASFTSETDAEVVAHLIAEHLDGDLVEAVRHAYNELRGHYSFVAISADHPELLVGARKECPLVVGVGDDEHFIASAIAAFLSDTRRVQLIEDGEIVAVTPHGASFTDAAGNPVERELG